VKGKSKVSLKLRLELFKLSDQSELRLFRPKFQLSRLILIRKAKEGGAAMDSLKFHLDPPCSILWLRPVGCLLPMPMHLLDPGIDFILLLFSPSHFHFYHFLFCIPAFISSIFFYAWFKFFPVLFSIFE
jgi:hypothetical protein